MEILGIGPSELVFIVLIAIIILGPKDMQKAGKTIGRWLNRFVHSDGWKALQRATREIQNLPTNLMREANLDELKEINKDIEQNIQSIDPRQLTMPKVSSPNQTSPASPEADVPPPNEAETTPQPPAENDESTSESTEQQ
jgi:sec-independent protein translocase protein TatB